MRTLEYKLSVLFLKYAPVIGALIMFLHVFLLITNSAMLIADWTFSLPIIPTIVAIIWSKTFGFCSIHRHFIGYICAVTYCIKFQSAVGFGVYLLLSRWIMFIIGLILFIWFAIRIKEFNYKCFKDDCKRKNCKEVKCS